MAGMRSIPFQTVPCRNSYKKYSRRIGPGAIVFDTFVSQIYLPHAQTRKRSWQVDERIARQHLSPIFGNRPLADISRSDVETWLQALPLRGLASSTCNRILAVLKSICSLACIYGCFPASQSPCTGVPSFKVHTQRERYLSLSEARRLMLALERSRRPEAFALRLLLLTGARKSEILRLRWENVRLDLHMLIVPLSKSGKPRHIPLSQEAVAVIRSLPRAGKSPWLFPGRASEKPLSDIYLFWDKIRKMLGLDDVRIHDLRHTFASLLVNAGHSLYEVQKLLGHSAPQTTMRYAHLGQQSLQFATETVSTLLLHLGGERKKCPFPVSSKGGMRIIHSKESRAGEKKSAGIRRRNQARKKAVSLTDTLSTVRKKCRSALKKTIISIY